MLPTALTFLKYIAIVTVVKVVFLINTGLILQP